MSPASPGYRSEETQNVTLGFDKIKDMMTVNTFTKFFVNG